MENWFARVTHLCLVMSLHFIDCVIDYFVINAYNIFIFIIMTVTFRFGLIDVLFDYMFFYFESLIHDIILTEYFHRLCMCPQYCRKCRLNGRADNGTIWTASFDFIRRHWVSTSDILTLLLLCSYSSDFISIILNKQHYFMWCTFLTAAGVIFMLNTINNLKRVFTLYI